VKKKPEEITVEGQVLDTDIRKVVKHGSSHHISIPADRPQPGWKKFLTATLLEVRLIKDNEGDDSILITRPKKKKVKP